MEGMIATLLKDFEDGKMDRRQLIQSLAMVAIAGRGFDAFLGGFQRLLERIAQEDAEAELREPQPIFVVPEEDPASGPGADDLLPPDQ